MLETLLAGSQVTYQKRSIRLVGLQAETNNLIGIHEFEIYDKAGNNVCRAAGYVPTVTYSPNANKNGVNFTSYPPENAIDGNSTNWQYATYMACALDYSAWLQFDFPKGFEMDYWQFKVESTWVPYGPGVALQVEVDGVWETVTAAIPPGGWYASTWHRFAGLSHT